MNGWLCLGLASALAAALFGQAALRAATTAGFLSGRPSDVQTPQGRAELRLFARKFFQAPALMAAALFCGSAAGTFLTTAFQ